ncbi:MAG: site-2 protease family protein [Ferrimicrobium sp.]
MRRDRLIAIIVVVVVLVVASLRGVFNLTSLIAIVCIIPSVILHEVSHGVVANHFGDDTARRAGRLTLNPLKHVDPFGTVILPLLLVMVGLTPIGYAKPVPIDPGRMRHGRNDAMLTALAGPAVNIVLAIAGGILLHLLIQHQLATASPAQASTLGSSLVDQGLYYFGAVNVVLAVFNLIPLPPLDGSAVVERFLPTHLWLRYLSIRRFALPVLFLLVLAVPTFLSSIISPITGLWSHVFLNFAP